jgi:hypothetical protein
MPVAFAPLPTPPRLCRPSAAPRSFLITASDGKTVAETFKRLCPGGVSILLGVGPEPIEVSGVDLVFGSRKLQGALTGDPATGDATLRFRWWLLSGCLTPGVRRTNALSR